MPLYKEHLDWVIRPSFQSIFLAASHYELYGGRVNFLVSDDGLQLLPEDERVQRRVFYEQNRIAWIARPKHSPYDGYVRRGKFKRASALNNLFNATWNMEEEFVQRLRDAEEPTNHPRVRSTEQADMWDLSMRNWLACSEHHQQADGYAHIEDLVLLVDSDVRVDENLFVYAATDAILNPEVDILRYRVQPMLVIGNAFEKWMGGLRYKLDRLAFYNAWTGLSPGCWGRNEFFRLRLLRAMSWVDHSESNMRKIWSEQCVNEDQDLSWRLQNNHTIIRLSVRPNQPPLSEEGVSLTMEDEIARTEKHAYGAMESAFNPLLSRKLFCYGPLNTPLVKTLLGPMPAAAKVDIIADIASHWLIASSFWVAIFSYFYLGWANGQASSIYRGLWTNLLEFVAGLFILVSDLYTKMP
ncbi:MAG: hypothetical protein Q9227_008822 [Pyrenula ochraceoflavens]